MRQVKVGVARNDLSALLAEVERSGEVVEIVNGRESSRPLAILAPSLQRLTQPAPACRCRHREVSS